MIMDRALRSLDARTHASQLISLNNSHDGPALQSALERQLEKKAGVHYGPRGSRRLVYWLDDASLPCMDKYGTQSALELVRQAIDYGGWYDKARAGAREVTGIGFAACVNPGAGSSTVGPKLQRHFVTLAMDPPTPADFQCVLAGLDPKEMGGARGGGIEAAEPASHLTLHALRPVPFAKTLSVTQTHRFIFKQLTVPYWEMAGFKKGLLAKVADALAAAAIDLHLEVLAALCPRCKASSAGAPPRVLTSLRFFCLGPVPAQHHPQFCTAPAVRPSSTTCSA